MIDTNAFNQALAQGDIVLSPCYLFYGQTPFLSEESATNLVQYAKNKGFSARQVFYLDNRFSAAPILLALDSQSLFDPKKIIELRFETDKPNKKLTDFICQISAQTRPHLLIIEASQLPYSQQKMAWFKSLLENKQISVVQSKPLYPKDLPNWVGVRAKQLGFTLSTEALKLIVHYSEGNLLFTQQILLQLAHSDYPRPISEAVVKAMLSDLSVFQIDDLNQALLRKDKKVLRIVEKLEKENEPLVLITSVLYREMDTLCQLSESTQQGEPLSMACKRLNVWGSKQSQYQYALKQYPASAFYQARQQLAALDVINKGQASGDGWLLLRQLLANMVFIAA